MRKILLSLAAATFATAPVLAGEVTDVLTIYDFGEFTSQSQYSTCTYTAPNSGITYGANIARPNDAAGNANGFQIRATSPSGIWVQENPDGLKLVSVTITWTKTTNSSSRTIDFYCKDSAYESGNLYATASQGTKIGSLVRSVNEGQTVSFPEDGSNLKLPEDDILYWGMRSNQSAIYLEPQIIVVYATADGPTLQPAGLDFETKAMTVLMGDEVPENVLENPNSLDVDFISSDESVATVDSFTGVVTAVGPGTATISAVSEETEEFRAGKASYTITVVGKANSVSEFYDITNGSTTMEVMIGFPAKVTYQSGNNTYFEANGEAGYIYGQVPTYEVGDIIPAGWYAKYGNYNGIKEMIPVTGKLPQVAEGQEKFTCPIVTSVSEDMMNQVVGLENVEVTSDTPGATATGTGQNFNVLWNGETLACRNNFKIDSVAPGAYDVKGIVEVFNNAVSFYVIEFMKLGSLGVDAVEVATEGEAVYYNLQGARVANPANGVFVRILNGKASKVVK